MLERRKAKPKGIEGERSNNGYSQTHLEFTLDAKLK